MVLLVLIGENSDHLLADEVLDQRLNHLLPPPEKYVAFNVLFSCHAESIPFLGPIDSLQPVHYVLAS